ncbi:histone-lysine N-methyltransferase SETMAR [Plakobranchus ocellatus]|uniref:Histone-lysine N-methyltransferase SETMAR n=1 Tax=Plakobranchus ocellatus TaxID=259542 RepID=A0AAV4A0K6_9GAST|nr:histone-lysine N-methyltransferase SETMAR [Plakobranchus ocellatus]
MLLFGVTFTTFAGFSSGEIMETKQSNDSFINNEPTWQSYFELIDRDIYLSVLRVMVWIVFGIGAMGILGNILIILVYIKLGFSETIHMSYLALAISDLLSVLSTVWTFIFLSPIFETVLKQLPIAIDLNFTSFTGAWPLLAFSRSTALITAWVSLERCLCVVFPTKVKRIITRTVTKIALLTIFIFGCGPIAFVYVGIESEWRLDPLRNQTKLFVFASDSKQTTTLKGFARVLYGLVYPVSSWVIVTVSTAILIIKLRASNLWRKQHMIRTVNEMRQTGDFHQRRLCERSNRQWLQRYGWKILPHPTHSPDLAPSDFHLFGLLKRHLGGMAFETEDDLISDVRN